MPVHIDDSQERAARVTFELPAAQHASAVSVVGSFNEWTAGANELHPDDAGMISATVDVPYGQDIYFRYLSEADGWFDDPEAEPAGDGSRIDPIPRPTTDSPAPADAPSTIDLDAGRKAQPARSGKSS